jgi:antirestriction protein ArdC
VNAATRREYRGVNVLMLWAAAEITGYQDGRWASFKQWQQIGAQVRRGWRCGWRAPSALWPPQGR